MPARPHPLWIRIEMRDSLWLQTTRAGALLDPPLSWAQSRDIPLSMTAAPSRSAERSIHTQSRLAAPTFYAAIKVRRASDRICCVTGLDSFPCQARSPDVKRISWCREACMVHAAVIVRSPFRAKHHVVMQYMAAGLKYPLPPPPLPLPPGQTPLARPPPWPDPLLPWTVCSMTGGRQGGQGRIDGITNAARDFAQ